MDYVVIYIRQHRTPLYTELPWHFAKNVDIEAQEAENLETSILDNSGNIFFGIFQRVTESIFPSSQTSQERK